MSAPTPDELIRRTLHHSRAAGTDKLVLLGIALHHATEPDHELTVATLAAYANVTDRAVQRSLRRLAQLDELTVERRPGGPNVYRLLVRCPAPNPATCEHHRPAGLRLIGGGRG